MLSLAEKLSPTAPAVLQNYVKVARHMDTLGTAMPARSCSSTPRPCRWSPGRYRPAASGMRATKRRRWRSSSAPVSKPVTGAVYLPTRMPGYEKAYLMAGQWEESGPIPAVSVRQR